MSKVESDVTCQSLCCREIECAVLGNEDPQASVVGEIDPGAEFYDYDTKYVDDTAQLFIPARLSEAAAEQVRQMLHHAPAQWLHVFKTAVLTGMRIGEILSI